MSDAPVLRAVGFVVGMVVTLLVGAVVPYVMRQTRSIVRLEAPRGVSGDQWQAVTDVGDDVRRPIEWQGKLERVLFFISFWLPVYEIAGDSRVAAGPTAEADRGRHFDFARHEGLAGGHGSLA